MMNIIPLVDNALIGDTLEHGNVNRVIEHVNRSLTLRSRVL